MKYLTFILGAGASVPYGFPTGYDLVTNLINNFTSGGFDNGLLQRLINFGNRLSLYDPDSIDQYIDYHFKNDSEARTIHKQAIMYEMLRVHCDAINKLKFGRANNENWMRYLLREYISFFDKYKESGVQGFPIKIITFNYDTSIEYYVHKILSEATVYTEEQKDKFLSWFDKSIAHVYGSVGSYKWRAADDATYATVWEKLVVSKSEFNIHEIKQHFFDFAQIWHQKLRLISEERAGEHNTQLREWIANSQSIIISGYGFAHENNVLLDIENSSRHVRNVIVGLVNTNKKTQDSISQMFQVGTHSITNTHTGRITEYDPNRPAEPTLNIYKMTTYELLRDAVTLSKLYSV